MVSNDIEIQVSASRCVHVYVCSIRLKHEAVAQLVCLYNHAPTCVHVQMVSGHIGSRSWSEELFKTAPLAPQKVGGWPSTYSCTQYEGCVLLSCCLS